MMKNLLIALSLTAFATPALAEFPIGKLGVNFSPKTDIDIDGAPEKGDGTGLGFYGELGSTSFFGYGDYHKSNLDIQTVDIDVDETRIGLGARGGNDTGLIEVRVENYDVDLDIAGTTLSDDGIGMHFGGELNVGGQAAVIGSYGILTLDDTDGTEFRLGAKLKPSDSAELYAVYRITTFEDDFNDEIELAEFRLGGNLLF